MKQPHWDRIQEIYHAALALPRSERSEFVANACIDNPELLREVTSLLEAEDSSGGFLESPVTRLGGAQDSLVGTAIGDRYLVERELGGGGMSQVYFGVDLRLQRRPVVIKILSQALIQDSYRRQKFEQEVEALLRIDHPGVVAVLDTGKLPDGRPYLVMQYVDGETLRSQIPNQGMELKRAASILMQIGEALEHVHGMGVVHRDLKPENIMLKRGTDSVVLIDFGIARVRDSLVASTTVNGPAPGTLVYMSPEQLRGQEITAASDVYSMAVIAYELVTGRRPFDATSAFQLQEIQRAGVRLKPVHLRQELPASAQRLILRALSFEPEARSENVKEFGENLGRALLDSHVPAKDRRRLKEIGAALIILVAVTLFSFAIYKYRRTSDTRPTHTFTYWLGVQKVRAGKEYQQPFKSNGEETFENGDKFRINVSGSVPGYLYIFNEGPPEPNSTSFTMIFPSAPTNNGSANLGASQTVQSDWITFRGPAGDENFWIVWSVSPVAQLESAKSEAFNHPGGGLTNQNLVAVKEFLRVKQLQVEVRVTHYKATQTAVVRGKSELLVTLAQFKHR